MINLHNLAQEKERDPWTHWMRTGSGWIDHTTFGDNNIVYRIPFDTTAWANGTWNTTWEFTVPVGGEHRITGGVDYWRLDEPNDV